MYKRVRFSAGLRSPKIPSALKGRCCTHVKDNASFEAKKGPTLTRTRRDPSPYERHTLPILINRLETPSVLAKQCWVKVTPLDGNFYRVPYGKGRILPFRDTDDSIG
jgi:hypothetical protein